MKRLAVWTRIAPAFITGSFVLLVVGSLPGAWLLDNKIGHIFRSVMFGGIVQLLVLGFGGWLALIGSLERVERAWVSLDSSLRTQLRRPLRAAGAWVWAYCLVWGGWVALFAVDRLPYRHPVFWIGAVLLWCIGLWTALSIRRRTNECLLRDSSSASPESPVASS